MLAPWQVVLPLATVISVRKRPISLTSNFADFSPRAMPAYRFFVHPLDGLVPSTHRISVLAPQQAPFPIRLVLFYFWATCVRPYYLSSVAQQPLAACDRPSLSLLINTLSSTPHHVAARPKFLR